MHHFTQPANQHSFLAETSTSVFPESSNMPPEQETVPTDHLVPDQSNNKNLLSWIFTREKLAKSGSPHLKQKATFKTDSWSENENLQNSKFFSVF